MSYTIVEEYTSISPLPTKDDGSKWTHALLFDEQLILADTATEIIALSFIEGYETIEDGEEGDQEALLARYTLATQLATMAQVKLTREYVDEHGGLDGLDEEIVNAAFAPRTEPIPLEGSSWNGPFPLVGIATNYSPFRPGVKIPKGNVLLVNPFTETTMLQSLNDIGVCSYRIHESHTGNAPTP